MRERARNETKVRGLKPVRWVGVRGGGGGKEIQYQKLLWGELGRGKGEGGSKEIGRGRGK